MSRFASFAIVLVLCGSIFAQQPVAELPRTYIDTTWAQPTGGTTWAAHTPAQLTSALNASQPGDIIVLDAGVTYSGYFQLPAKSNPNHKWIYIVSSGLAKLPAGRRVSPADARNMARIVSPNTASPFTVANGANYWRLAGLEITANSNFPKGCGVSGQPNCMTYFMMNLAALSGASAHHVYLDRVYAHGSPTQDFQGGLIINWDWAAVIDSYVDDVHIKGFDSVGVGCYHCLGPVKIVNNYISASTENIMFGGSGAGTNLGVPSDIEIRNNYLYKPLAWAVPGVGVAPNQTMVVKNALEVKCGQRILFDSNTIENMWSGGQLGYAIVLTVRTGQSGDFCVDNDITITNNVLKNVVSGINGGAADDTCGAAGGYPSCHNAGSQARWYIANNLFLFYDPTIPGGARNLVFSIQPGLDRINNNRLGVMHDIVFQHNTMVSAASTPCWNSVYFGTGPQKPPFTNLTNNVWILDNVLCRQPSGDWGLQGTSGLTGYMGSPAALDTRYKGNVMYVPKGDKVQTFPVHNYASTLPFTYESPAFTDYQLLTPYWTDTSDGRLAGVNYSLLRNALASAGQSIPPGSVRPTTAAPR